MPVKHASRTCPFCQYGLVTCVGDVDATQLTGVCPSCGRAMVIDVSTGAQGIPVDNEPHTIAVTDTPTPAQVLAPETVYAPLVQPKPPATPNAEQGPKPTYEFEPKSPEPVAAPPPPKPGSTLFPKGVENP